MTNKNRNQTEEVELPKEPTEPKSDNTRTESDSTRPNKSGLAKLLDKISSLSSPKEKGYTGFLSYSAEWHALAVGFGIGFYYPEMIQPFMAYVVGKGGGKAMSSDQHIQDAKREPVYAILGLALAKAFKHSPQFLQNFAI